MTTVKEIKSDIFRDIFEIIDKINLTNDNGKNQYTCELIKKKIMKELLDKDYLIKYRQPERHDWNEV